MPSRTTRRYGTKNLKAQRKAKRNWDAQQNNRKHRQRMKRQAKKKERYGKAA